MTSNYRLAEEISSNRNLLMGVAMVFIIMCHQPFLSSAPFYFLRFCGHFGVDVFLFLSGFGCIYSLTKHSVRTFYQRRLVRLAPTVLFCGFIKYGLSFIETEPFSTIHMDYTTIWGWDLWFFRPLITFYLLAPILFKIIDWVNVDKKKWAVFGGVFFISIFFSEVQFLGKYFAWSASRFPAFFMGMYIARKQTVVQTKILHISILFLFVALGYRAVSLKIFPNINELWTNLFLSLSIPSLCFFVIMLLIKTKIRRVKWVQDFFICSGIMSLELYCWHEYIFELLGELQYNAIVLFICAIILSYSLSYFTKRFIADLHFK